MSTTTILIRAKEFRTRRQREIGLALIALAIAVLSFGLGYLTARDNARAPIIIERNSGSN